MQFLQTRTHVQIVRLWHRHRGLARRRQTGRSAVTFSETPAGEAPAIKALFYGGLREGYEFVYPHGE
jgi:hypothetical protein